jgi:hypothetical protein
VQKPEDFVHTSDAIRARQSGLPILAGINFKSL